MIIPVVMCGGAGTRLWPLSRDHRPKPLLPLLGGTSTLAATLERVAAAELFGPPLVIANRDHRYMIADVLRAVGIAGELLLEPEPRDTTAAVATATQWVMARHPDAVLLVLAADHLIKEVDGFRRTVQEAREAAEAGWIVTFGVRPTHPATSYGYIHRGEVLPEGHGLHRVAGFIEKPGPEAARRYVSSGYLWNSGNFMMRAAVAQAELDRQAPDIMAVVSGALAGAIAIDGGSAMLADSFRAARRISFDHSVMEKTDRAAVIDAGFDWSDLGTWGAVWEAADKDEHQNVKQGRVAILSASGNYVSSDGTAIGVVGVDDLVVVASDNTVLVAPRSQSEAVKQLVALVNDQPALPNAVDIRRHFRPWGHYQSIDLGPSHQVKRLIVNPGQRLSLQKHRFRSEHWTVVEGVAEVTLDDRKVDLGPNESIYIPLGAVHRAANRGTTPVTIVEVQCGTYFGEDDIIRIEDDYGRIRDESEIPA